MKTEYVRELKENYLKIMGNDCDEYGMKMLLGQEIRGLLSVSERKINGESHFMYKVSSFISMEELLINRALQWQELNNLIKAFIEIFDVLDDYLMDYNALVLKPEMIYTDINMDKWYFVYYGEWENNFYQNLRDLFEYVIKVVNHKDTRAVTIAYGVYKRLCEENPNPRELFEFETVDNDYGEIIKEHNPVETVLPEIVEDEEEVPDKLKLYMIYGSAGIYGIIVIYAFLGVVISGLRIKGVGAFGYVISLIILGVIGYMAYNWYAKNKSTFVKVEKRRIEIPFEKEKVRINVPQNSIEDENLTVFLKEEDVDDSHYVRWNDVNGEKNYRLDNKITLIGSARDKVDCLINERGISRIHARISIEGQRFYIKDMNSTNGTKVNGRALVCYELCEIKPMDRIELGNLECVFV